MSLVDRMLIDLIDHAFKNANAPLIYVHRTGEEPAYCAIITTEHLRAITDMIPTSARLNELMLNHSHIEGDDPWPDGR